MSMKKSFLRADDKEIKDYLEKLSKIKKDEPKKITPLKVKPNIPIADYRGQVASESDLLKLGFLVKDVFDEVYQEEKRVDKTLGDFRVTGYPIVNKNQDLIRIDVHMK